MARPADPIKRLARAFAKAARPALEATFHHWRDHMAEYHFRREAFDRYPKEYAASAKRDAAKWLARRKRQAAKYQVDPQARPLVKTRRFRSAFLVGPVLFTGSASRLRVRWAGLPRHATLANRFSGFAPAQAVTTVSDRERETLDRVYHGTLLRYAERDSQIPIATHGRAAL